MAGSRSMLIIIALFFSASVSAVTEAEKIAICNKAMLHDFEGMSQEDMMECAELLEEPLKHLEEEQKAQELAERAAAAQRKAEEEARQAAAAAAAKKKREEEAAIALQKSKQREQQAMTIRNLEMEKESCAEQLSSALVSANSLARCEGELANYVENSVPVSPAIRPLFGSRSLEVVVAPILTVFCILFWMLGCCIGSSRVTPMMNPAAGVSGVTISDVVINPGNEVCTIKNRTFSDVDLTGCSLRVADHVYHFDDGYNLAKSTSVEIHAGPEAKEIKKLPFADHEKFDSRRCNKLFWTSASVFLGSGETTATLMDANEHTICRSK